MTTRSPQPANAAPQPGDLLLEPAFSLLSMGNLSGAAATLADLVMVAPELAVAHEMLGGLSLGALDDYPMARRHLGIAYRLHRNAGDVHSAARCATVLAQVEATSGNRSESSGW